MAMRKRDIEELAEEWWPEYSRQAALAEELDKWVEVKNEDPSLPKERTTNEYRTLQEVSKTPWARLIITEVAQSLFADGFRHGSDSENSPVWGKLWQPNGLDARQIAVHRAALNHGLSYVVVLPGVAPLGREKTSVVRGVSARKGVAVFRDDPLDPEDEWPLLFLHVDEIRVPGANGPVKRIRIIDEENIYTVDYDPEDKARFSYVSEQRHGTGVPPVVRFANMLDLDGVSMGEIEPVIPLLRRIDQDAFDRLIVQRYQSWQVRTITGMEKPKSGDAAAEAMRMRVNDLLIAENADAKFGTLPSTPLDGLLHARDSDLRDLGAVTQTPPHHLLGLSPNVSADGLVEAQASLMRKIEERQQSFGDSWERVLRIGAHQMGMTKEATDFEAEIRWRDTESRSLNQVADALGKMSKLLGIPAQMLWERVPDWTDQDTTRALELLGDTSEEQELLRRITGGATASEVAAEADANAAAKVNPESTSGEALVLDPDDPKRKAANRKRGGYGPDWDGDGKVG